MPPDIPPKFSLYEYLQNCIHLTSFLLLNWDMYEAIPSQTGLFRYFPMLITNESPGTRIHIKEPWVHFSYLFLRLSTVNMDVYKLQQGIVMMTKNSFSEKFVSCGCPFDSIPHVKRQVSQTSQYWVRSWGLPGTLPGGTTLTTDA